MYLYPQFSQYLSTRLADNESPNDLIIIRGLQDYIWALLVFILDLERAAMGFSRASVPF